MWQHGAVGLPLGIGFGYCRNITKAMGSGWSSNLLSRERNEILGGVGLNLFPLLINTPPPIINKSPQKYIYFLIGVFGVGFFLLFQQCEGSRRIWIKWIEL